MSTNNPVVALRTLLGSAWNTFATERDPRLLLWLATPDESRMVEAMVVAEGDARAAEVPDLFVQVRAPFVDAVQYGAAVRSELLQQYESSWEALPESERPPRFVAQPGELQATAAAFVAHHEKVFEHLVLVLRPTEVEDDAAYASWLAGAAVAAAPTSRLRFLAIVARDADGEALAAAVCEQAGGRARVEKLDLNMPALYEAMSRQAGDLGSPGGRFRHLFVQLTNAVGAGDLSQAQRLAQSALAITQAQSWPSLAVAVHFALGGGFLSAARPQDALSAYQAALAAAKSATAAGAAEGAGLELRSLFAIGSTQVRSADYLAAARTYEQAAPLATAQADPLMQLESLRMAAFCHEAAGSPERAWQHAQNALTVAQAMPPDARATSTLPYLGEAITRLGRVRGGLARAE